MIVLNTAVAEQLLAFKGEADALIEKGVKKDEAIFQVLRKYIIACKKIRFEGNGYSKEWREEAERRGLPNLKAGIDSVEALRTEKAVRLFESFGVYTRTELESRAEIEYDSYAKTINIEALTMIDMASKQIIPAVVKYTKSLADTVIAVREAGADASAQTEILKAVSEKLSAMKSALGKLEEVESKAGTIGNAKEQAFIIRMPSRWLWMRLRALPTRRKCWWIKRYGRCLPMEI